MAGSASVGPPGPTDAHARPLKVGGGEGARTLVGFSTCTQDGIGAVHATMRFTTPGQDPAPSPVVLQE